MTFVFRRNCTPSPPVARPPFQRERWLCEAGLSVIVGVWRPNQSPSPRLAFESDVAIRAGTKSASFPEFSPRNGRFCTVRSCVKNLGGSCSIFRRGWRGKPPCPFPPCEAGADFSEPVRAWMKANFVSSCLSTFSNAARSCSMVSGWSTSANGQ